MPQMNPIFWVTLFTVFISIFITTNCINYFYPNKFNYENKSLTPNIKSLPWKW
uniref:ATP synthase complex subunit 8 n=1 Tax=Caecilius quercus TaxID=159986 RepID=Q85RU1_9NEOP|nr:ATP synthase subunit 8 [Caecilius quercus]